MKELVKSVTVEIVFEHEVSEQEVTDALIYIVHQYDQDNLIDDGVGNIRNFSIKEY